jgi:ribonuclease P protein subunit RPR2
MAKEKKQGRSFTGTQKIAIERMYRLNELAEDEVKNNPKRSARYVELIRGLSTRFRISIPREIKDRFCKTCGNYWAEGVSVKRRVKGKTKNSNCRICGTLTRRKISEEKNEEKRKHKTN